MTRLLMLASVVLGFVCFPADSHGQLFSRLRIHSVTKFKSANQALTICSSATGPEVRSTSTCSTVASSCPEVRSSCSIQESVLPQTTYVTEATNAIQNRKLTFRQALMKAASNAHHNGEITILQYFALARSSLNPAKLAEMQQSVHESAVQEGLATATAIDWNKLIEFIEKLIPIIIKLIDLFGYTLNDVQTMLVTTDGATLIMNDGFVFVIAS